jgi:tetratricopeptide (TPR) repeat protein
MGLALAANGQLDRAGATLADLKKDIEAVTSATEPLNIAALELEGTIAARSGNTRKGFDLFKRAATREAQMIYTEPPAYPRPVVEGLGNVALAAGDHRAAAAAFREALEREPGSGRAYFGLSAALDHLGQAAEARDAQARGVKAWAAADPDLPQLRRGSTAGQH